MATDTLRRRLRTAAPSGSAKRLVLSDADYRVFEALERHGPLPSNYLFEFTKHLRRDRTHLQNRLTEFYHGDAGGPYLIRPPQQFASFHARYQHLVYELSARAKRALAERSAATRAHPHRSDPFVHRLMGACVAASIELAAASRGLRYISLAEILAHPRCAAGRQPGNPLIVPLANGLPSLIPDGLFGLEYPEDGFRFFAVEVDRNTESIERKNLRLSAFARKIASYGTVLRDQTYRTWWGVPNLHVLIITTNATHGHNILDHIRRQSGVDHQPRFALAIESSFGMSWSVPDHVLSELVTKPWATATGNFSIDRP